MVSRARLGTVLLSHHGWCGVGILGGGPMSMLERFRLLLKRWLVDEEEVTDSLPLYLLLGALLLLALAFTIYLLIVAPMALLLVVGWVAGFVAITWLVVRLGDWISK